MEDKVWERWMKIEPELIKKEVFIDLKKEFDKLEKDEDTGTNSTGASQRSTANRSKPGAVGTTAKKQGRPKKVHDSETASKEKS